MRPPTVDGTTPLSLAVEGDYEHHVKFLISRGMEFNKQNIAGESLLDIAVQTCAHKTLCLLLEVDAKCTLRTNAGETLLHQTAQYGDMESLNILMSFCLRDINVGDRVTGFIEHQSSDRLKGFTTLQIAEQREDVSPEWQDLFRKLIHHVKSSEISLPGENSLDEIEEFEDALEHQID